MKFHLLFSFLFLSLSGIAQEEISLVDKLHLRLDWEFGVHSSGERFLGQKIAAEYELTPIIRFGSGIGYDIISCNCNVTNSSRQEFFGINNDSAITRLTPESAHYLNIPLNISFNGKRTQFQCGISNNFFFGAKGSIDDGGFDFFFNNNFIGFRTNPLVWVKPYGFRKYFTGIHFSGSYFGRNGFGFKLGYFKAVTSLAKSSSEIPSGESLFRDTNKPVGITFGLTYKLF